MRPFTAAVCMLALLSCLGCGGDSHEGAAARVSSEGEQASTARERASAAFERGDLKTAAHELQAQFDAGDRSIALLDELASLWQRLEEVPRAAKVLEAGLEAHPDSGTLAARLGGLWLWLGQPQKAREILEQAREKGASDAQGVALVLARVHGALGEYEGAQEEIERARAAGEDPVEVDYLEALLELARGRPERALPLFESASKGRPDDLEILRERERARLQANADDAAVAQQVIGALDPLLDETRRDWRAYMIAGDAYMVLDDPDAALAHYLKALEYGQNPPTVEERYRRAKIASNAKLRAMGLEPPDAVPRQKRHDAPPLPASLEDYEGFWHRDS